MDPKRIDTTNKQGVGLTGAGHVHVLMPLQTMTIAEALTHAAWLVTVAEQRPGDFERVLHAVRTA